MKREDFLRTKEHWLIRIQNDLFNLIENYMERKSLSRTELAKELGVTKGYVTQILNGDFDHKISKLVELALACNSFPMLHFVDANKYIADDSKNKRYELMAMVNPSPISYIPKPQESPNSNSITIGDSSQSRLYDFVA
jgi:transcriptional regulator with XRE-family HTH domain